MLDKAAAVLESIEKLLEVESGASEEVLAALVNELYEGVVKKYRPVIGILPNVSDKIGKDILPIIVAGLKLANTISEDVNLQTERARGKKLKALTRFESLTAYHDVGFTHNEAMALILADIANQKANWEKVQSSTKSSSSR
jgi:hypothetical protein